MRFDNYMNINLGNQGHPQGFTPMLIGEASPYLSPLNGSLSVIDVNSPDQLLDFQLEEQPLEPLGGEIEFREEVQNPEFFTNDKEGFSEDVHQKQESRFQKSQIQTPASLNKSNHSKVQQQSIQHSSIIQFLVLNDSQNQNDLLIIGKPLYESSNNLQFIFKVLLAKFKKLRKTKEEMVKYCMRKAFKFVTDLKKSAKPGRNRKQKADKNTNSDKDLSIEMPFRKNSSQKTMNSQFLKHVFSNKQFLSGYSEFLSSISSIIQDDNNSKIAYLSESIQKILCNSDVKQVQGIKRLPWTKTILMKTEELARNLTEFANFQVSLEKFDQGQNY